MTTLYREHILDHYRNPRNRGVLEGADLSAELDNPTCGDVVRLDVQLEGEGEGEEKRVRAARFSGQGCVVSMATASMLTEWLTGKTLTEITALKDEDILAMVGAPLGAVRAKCALLPLRTLQAGLKQWKNRGISPQPSTPMS